MSKPLAKDVAEYLLEQVQTLGRNALAMEHCIMAVLNESSTQADALALYQRMVTNPALPVCIPEKTAMLISECGVAAEELIKVRGSGNASEKDIAAAKGALD